jgi:hypothetical protein
MQLSHIRPVVSAVFDDPNLVSSAGLVPVMKLAQKAGLRSLVDERLSIPTDKGANAGLKVSSLVGGMVAGADSIDDMGILRHGGMGKLFDASYAPSTLGSFLREFTFGHVRQLDAVASRFLPALMGHTPTPEYDCDEYAFVDVDDTIVEVYGHKKQGSGYGYSGVRGLNVLLGTVTHKNWAPLIVGQRLRRGACYSARGAKRFISDALTTAKKTCDAENTRFLVRADSAFYTHAAVTAAVRGGAHVSITVKRNPAVVKAINTIDENAWINIEYTDAVYDEDTGELISDAQVTEIPFTAFTSQRKNDQIEGRLVVRRVPDTGPRTAGNLEPLFPLYRYHAFFTTSTLDTVTADKTHRAHAIIEQVNADIKNGPLAHMPSGKFTANAAWLVLAVMSFNLSRIAAIIADTGFTRATTGTIRRKLINLPARIATSARRVILHLPTNWPRQTAWTNLFNYACGPPQPVSM